MTLTLQIAIPDELTAELRCRAESLGLSSEALAAEILAGSRRPRLLLGLGRVVVSREARRVFAPGRVSLPDLLDRHRSGEPGALDPAEAIGNLVAALEGGGRFPVLSSWPVPGRDSRICIETDLRRERTIVETTEELVARGERRAGERDHRSPRKKA